MADWATGVAGRGPSGAVKTAARYLEVAASAAPARALLKGSATPDGAKAGGALGARVEFYITRAPQPLLSPGRAIRKETGRARPRRQKNDTADPPPPPTGRIDRGRRGPKAGIFVTTAGALSRPLARSFTRFTTGR